MYHHKVNVILKAIMTLLLHTLAGPPCYYRSSYGNIWCEEAIIFQANALHNTQIIDQWDQKLLFVLNVRIPKKNPKIWFYPGFCTNHKVGRNSYLMLESDLTAGASDSSNWMLASKKIYCNVRVAAASDANRANACKLVVLFLSRVRIYPTTHCHNPRDNNPQTHCIFDILLGNEIRNKDLISNAACRKRHRTIHVWSKCKIKKKLYI
jgi:hypothetical protein